MKKGFTLAEVLITLGIIGVVSAITIPTLIQNYQKKLLASQLKKTLSTVQQGIYALMADEGVSDINDIENADEKIRKYFKVLKVEKPAGYKVCISDIHCAINNPNEADDLSDDTFMFLPDGSMVKFDGISGIDLWFQIDVNGLKKPNTYGYDFFGTIFIDSSGKINFNTGGLEDAIFN